MHIEKAKTVMDLDPDSEEVESEDHYNIKNLSESDLKLLKSALQAAHMMEEPVESSIEIEDVEELHDKIEEALKDPAERLEESIQEMKGSPSIEEQLRDKE